MAKFLARALSFILLLVVPYVLCTKWANQHLYAVTEQKVLLEPKWEVGPVVDSINKVEYYCPPETTDKVKDAFTRQAQAAAFLRDVMRNPFANETTAAMVDLMFRGAFTRLQSGSRNMAKVARVFDAMARGVALNEDVNNEETPARFFCLRPSDSTPVVKNSTMAATAELGMVFLASDVEEKLNWYNNNGQVCRTVKMSADWAWPMSVAHEMAHLADVRDTRSEAYDMKTMNQLEPEQALLNAQNYASTILCKIQQILFIPYRPSLICMFIEGCAETD